MKALLVFVAVMAVLFGGLIALTFFLIAHPDDQSRLTSKVDVTITHSEKWRRNRVGHNVDYTYRVGSRRFVHRTWISNTGWMPGRPLSACVDPEHPTRHTLRTTGLEVCGEDHVTSIETATPAPH